MVSVSTQTDWGFVAHGPVSSPFVRLVFESRSRLASPAANTGSSCMRSVAFRAVERAGGAIQRS